MKSALIDMRLSEEDKAKMNPMPGPANTPDYPYGLCLCLGDSQLDKLDVDATEITTGDFLDLRCMAMVTSVNESMVDGKPCYRVELQVTHMSVPENETQEQPRGMRNKRPYF